MKFILEVPDESVGTFRFPDRETLRVHLERVIQGEANTLYDVSLVYYGPFDGEAVGQPTLEAFQALQERNKRLESAVDQLERIFLKSLKEYSEERKVWLGS